MLFVFIYGPPAAGKFTVAAQLAKMMGAELYHNHIVVDEVLSKHAFGTPEFVRGRDRLWREYFSKFPGPGKERVIFTFNPENSVPQEFIDWLFTSMETRRVNVFSVQLSASEKQLEQRMNSEQRQQFQKLTDLELYKTLRDSGTFATPLIPRTDLKIDSGEVEPMEAARLIVKGLEEAPHVQS